MLVILGQWSFLIHVWQQIRCPVVHKGTLFYRDSNYVVVENDDDIFRQYLYPAYSVLFPELCVSCFSKMYVLF